ncbi:hypothetical protein KP509_31G056600 [Ceratopteris richardii]|uniref:Bidirectional sugar transporter SWEET n=2 Tax=Ceratopteris richardii TaxID=49495 RepID=A0A8T2QYL0_CERRI|nr:hypothetical protein KP509_31G056600 [Ceratopteris richardii]
MSSTDTASTAIGIIGNITAVLLFLSPAPTFFEIWRKKSSGSYSGVPYVSSLANCLLWVFYGLPILTQGLVLVITINGFGVVLESIYLAIFVPFSHGRERMRMLVFIAVVLIVYAIIVILTLEVLPNGKKAMFVGIIAAVINTVMYAAPLAVMKHVITTKNVESMPFLLSLCTFINSCLWAIYGILKVDPYIIIPNVLGVIFGIMQLVLYGYYRDYDTRVVPIDVDDSMTSHRKKKEVTSV